MSVPVQLSDLAEQVEARGPVAYLVTVSDADLPHVVGVRVRWHGADLVVGAGRRTAANAARHPDVTLLWPAPPGEGYCLIVDGRAVVRSEETEQVLAVEPVAAVLHRTPEGDPASPSCVTVLARA